MRILLASVLVSLVTTLSLGGCSSGGSCASACSDAQTQKCTSIQGDCATFCSAGEGVATAAACTAAWDAYETCLGADDVCTADARCGAQQTALGTCAQTYCLSNLGDPDCQTLMKAFGVN